MEAVQFTLQQLEKITNNFSDDRIIGDGTYGVVYKGIMDNGEEIAVKKLYALSGHADEQFENELRNLIKVQHKNIVRLLGYCYEIRHRHVDYNGELVFARVIERALSSEYCQAGSLRNHHSDIYSGLDWPTRYKIIKGTCEGLKYLHGQNPPLYHLDIKPDNILLDKHMEPKLSDFGLCMMFNSNVTRNTILAKTTVAYVSPEYRYDGEISPKADIYSIGVVMIEIIAGPTGRSICSEMPRQDFIDLVRGNWGSRFRQIFRGSTLDAYCQQVERCTEIALNCMEIDPHNRPGILDVTIRLNETETETHEGFVDPQVWKMSFKQLQEITSNFSEEIGKGAFGAVYKGKLKNGEVVAVKKLDNFLANQRKQIESEEHLKNLEHKNIVQLIGYCEETMQVVIPDTDKAGEYKVMDVTESLVCYEFLSNGSLEDKMWKANSPALDWETCHTLIQGICEGLHYLHHGCPNAPIVHRDLKPANILLDDDMVPKLGDFGLSRIVPETQAHITAVAVGSRGYMAPETINHREITPKADIYSLGVLILEIITRKKCPSDREYSGKHYVEQVREDRKQNSCVASRYPLFEDRFLQQVDSWISIGLRCAEELHQERPPIEHIIHFLETESANSVGTPDREVRMISFKEMEDITNMFSERQLHSEGIFGAVYEGRRVDGEEMTVIKLKEHRRPLETQFNQVVNVLRFEHKNILQLKGYCSETIEVTIKEKHGGEMIERLLCYEFLQNGSLDRKIFGDQSPLSWEERYRIIQDICQVLKYLHEECEDAPQVHMGITPGNIWLDNDMLPKVGCCGLSRLFASDPTQIYNTAVVGSWGHIAPEHNELTKISTKSDIYSLGVLIIEIVTREKCPSNDNGSAESFIANVCQSWLSDSHIATKYPSLNAICIQQVKGCIKIGSHCTEIIPDKRPTAGEIVPMLVEECTKKPGFWNALCSGIC